MKLINPYSGTNTDVPNMALAYIAAIRNELVIDFNTKPKVMEKAEKEFPS